MRNFNANATEFRVTSNTMEKVQCQPTELLK